MDAGPARSSTCESAPHACRLHVLLGMCHRGDSAWGVHEPCISPLTFPAPAHSRTPSVEPKRGWGSQRPARGQGKGIGWMGQGAGHQMRPSASGRQHARRGPPRAKHQHVKKDSGGGDGLEGSMGRPPPRPGQRKEGGGGGPPTRCARRRAPATARARRPPPRAARARPRPPPRPRGPPTCAGGARGHACLHAHASHGAHAQDWATGA